MGISCRKYEKLLCLYVDGLLESDEHEYVLKHIAACTRCTRYLHLLQQSGEAISQAQAAGKTFLSHDTVERFVQDTLTSGHTPFYTKMLPWHSWPDRPLPRFALVGSAFTVVLTIIATVFFLRQLNKLPTNLRTHSPVTQQLPHQELLPSQESSFTWLNDGCAIKMQPGAQASILSKTPRTVRLDLQSGEVLVVGIEGLYDTIEVRSEPFVIRTMGTRFSVRRMYDSLEVRVLQGAVLISNLRDSATRVEAGLGVHINTATQKITCNQLDKDTQNRLIADFSAVSSHDNTTSRNTSQSGNPADKPDKKTSGRASNAVSSTPTDNFQDLMERAERLLSRNMWHACINTLNRYLEKGGSQVDKAHYMKAVSFSRIGRYEDAVQSFSDAARHSTERFRHEAALHFANRLLFNKLGDYHGAQKGINEYLTRYPDGKYAVFERHYLIEILIANGDNDTGLLLMQRYVADYPDECPSRQYRKILAVQGRDTIVESTLKHQ